MCSVTKRSSVSLSYVARDRTRRTRKDQPAAFNGADVRMKCRSVRRKGGQVGEDARRPVMAGRRQGAGVLLPERISGSRVSPGAVRTCPRGLQHRRAPLCTSSAQPKRPQDRSAALHRTSRTGFAWLCESSLLAHSRSGRVDAIARESGKRFKKSRDCAAAGNCASVSLLA